MASNLSATPVAVPAANPVPFGLACYGISVFLLSAFIGGWLPGPQGVIGFAIFTGGLGMVIAGGWAFLAGSTFGGTVLTGYGAFWASTAIYLWFLVGSSKGVNVDLAWVAAAWGIFTGYMALCAAKAKLQLVTVVLAILFVVFLLVWIGNAFHVAGAVKIGAILGIVSAIVAWFESYRGVSKSIA